MRRPVPFGKYLLLDRIAVGGMAEVFAAKAFGVEGFERTIAIKRILPNMVEDDEFIAMFIDEARIAALLTHANIAQIYELGRHDETYYIAMEYVSGRDARLVIDRFRKKGQPVPFPMAAYILAKMAEGLDYAHGKRDQNGQPLGIIHRDISPQNVLVSYDGDVKLIDFGIAKAAGRSQKTQAGILKGKFAYMSPEQVRGIPVDYRSDLYSAGVMLYEMITGSRLFTGESDFSTLEKVRAGTVRAPSELNADIPPQLEQVVLKALAKDRDERYQSGAELHDDLMRFLFAGKEIYSAKNLAAYMKEAFVDDYKKEQERIRRWQETTAEDVDDYDEPSQSGQRRKVRIGGESTSSAEKGKSEPRSSIRKGSGGQSRANDDEAPPDDGATQVRHVDDLATQVRAIDDPTDGATAIIRRPEEAAAPVAPPPPKREKTALLDEREILANSKPPARKRRSRSRLPSVAVGVGAICLALGVADLQINKGQHGLLVVIKGPKTAQAFVDGSVQSLGNGQFLFRGTPADHALKVTADGFTPFEAKFSLATSSNPLEVTLTKAEAAPQPPPPPPPTKVEAADAGTVASTTADAGSPGGQVAGQEPDSDSKSREQQLQDALHKLKGADSGAVAQEPNGHEAGTQKDPGHHEGAEKHVENGIATEGTKPPPPPPPPPPPAKVALSIVTTTPPSAMVMIRVDGKSTGGPKKTPVTVPDLKVGQVVAMQFVEGGYEPLSQQYTVTGHGDSVTVAMVKRAAPPPPPVDAKATLKVMCVPKAKIVVDDKVVGRTNPPGMTDIVVTAGKHQVCCESETGTRSALKELIFAAGGEATYKARVQ